MSGADFLAELAARGRYHFTVQEAVEGLGSSAVAARATLRRLRQKGRIAMPQRGFWVIVPPEYRRLGCLPAEQFVPHLMEHLGLEYYAALLSAAQMHGAAHQRPQVFQIMVAKGRPPIGCGEVHVQFVGRHNVGELPVVSVNTPRGPIRVSSAATTAFDLVGYPEHSGGLDNVATVLAELAESLVPDQLVTVARLSRVAWAQRLGYLLSLVGAKNHLGPLADHVAGAASETVLLDPARPRGNAARDARWKLIPNVEVTLDL